MSNERILIAEDDERSGKLLRDVLTANNYNAVLATNGRDALNEFRKQPSSVVITDLEMPVMDGNELIGHLREYEEEPVIFVTTAHVEASLIIDVMKKGVYDYLVKPVDVNDLLLKVKRALEIYELRKMKKAVDGEKVIRLENQMEWVRWQERMKHRKLGEGITYKTMFQSLRTSFTQGAGFGSMTTLLNMIHSFARKDGNRYIIEIEEEFMNLLDENAKMAEKAVNVFSDIEWIVSNELNLQPLSYDDIYSLILNAKDESGRLARIKNQVILLNDKKSGLSDKFVEMDGSFFSRVIKELLVNGMKFSEDNSKIYILYDISNKNMTLSVISKPRAADRSQMKGIPPEYANIIFEPFFRISNSVNENFDTLDFGLGLTEAEKIVEKHMGKIQVTNILDHTSDTHDPQTKVNFTVTLPVVE